MAEGDRIVMGLFGGLVLGAWIYGLLFNYSRDWEPIPWFLWGLVGLAMAGGIWATRAVSQNVRIGIVAGVGALTTITVIYAIVQSDLYGLATLVTIFGAGLLASAIDPPEFKPAPGPTKGADDEGG